MKRIFLLSLVFLFGCDKAFFFSGGATEANLNFTIVYNGETIAEVLNCSSTGMNFEIPLGSLEVKIRRGDSYLEKEEPSFKVETVFIPPGGHLILFADLGAYGYNLEDLQTGILYNVLLEYSSKAPGGWNGCIIGEGRLSFGAINRKVTESLGSSFIYYTVFTEDGSLLESKELTGEGWRLLCYPYPLETRF